MGKKTKYIKPNSCESAQFRRKRKPSKESSQTGGLVSSSVSRNTEELVRLLLDCVEQIPALTDQLAQNILGNEATEKKSEEIKNIDFENCSENCIQNIKYNKHVEVQNSIQVSQQRPHDDKAVEAKNRSADTMKCALKLVEACCDRCTIDDVLQIPQEVKYEVRAATERLQKLLNDLSAEALKAITDCLRQAIASASEYGTEACDPSVCTLRDDDLKESTDETKQRSSLDASTEKHQSAAKESESNASTNKGDRTIRSSSISDNSSPKAGNNEDEATSDKRKGGGGMRVTISVLSAAEIQVEETDETKPTDQSSKSKDNDVGKNPSQSSLSSKQGSSKKSLKKDKSKDKLDRSKTGKSRSQDNSESQHSLTSKQNSSKKSIKKNKSKDKFNDSKTEKSSKKGKSGKDGAKKESQVSMVFDKEQNANITPRSSMTENRTDDQKIDQKLEGTADDTSSEHKPIKQSKEEQKRSSIQEPTQQNVKESKTSMKASKTKLKDSKHGKSESDHKTEKSKSSYNDLKDHDGAKVKSEEGVVKATSETSGKNPKKEKFGNNHMQRQSESSIKAETLISGNSDEIKARCCETTPQACKQSHDTSKCKMNLNHSDDSKEDHNRSNQDIDDHKYGKSRSPQDESSLSSKSKAHTENKKGGSAEGAAEKLSQSSPVHIESSSRTRALDMQISRTAIIITDSADIKEIPDKKQSGQVNSNMSSRRRLEESTSESQKRNKLSNREETSNREPAQNRNKAATNEDSKTKPQEHAVYPSRSSKAVTDLTGKESRGSRGSISSYTQASEQQRQHNDKRKTGTKKDKQSEAKGCRCYYEKKSSKKTSSGHSSSKEKKMQSKDSSSDEPWGAASTCSCTKKPSRRSSNGQTRDRRGSVSSNHSSSSITSSTSTSCKKCGKHKLKKKKSKEKKPSRRSSNGQMSDRRGSISSNHSYSSIASSTSICSCTKKPSRRSSNGQTRDRRGSISSNHSFSSITSSTSTSCRKCGKHKLRKKKSKEKKSSRRFSNGQTSDRRGSISSNYSFSSIASFISTPCKKCSKHKLKKKKSKEKKSSKRSSNGRISDRRGSVSSYRSEESETSICLCEQRRNAGSNDGGIFSELICAIEDFLDERCFRIFFGPSLDETAIAFYETYPLLPRAASNARDRFRSMLSNEEEY